MLRGGCGARVRPGDGVAMGKPCQDRHPDPAAGCRLCWLARYDARYMRAWGIPGDPEPVPEGSEFEPATRKPAAPCAHRGPELTGPEREAAGVDHRRAWYRCGLWLSVGGSPPGIVCVCRGCGPGCPGYRAGEGE